MLNETFTITPINNNRATISWTAANADDVSVIYIDGEKVKNIFSPTAAARSAIVSWQKSDAIAIEIHDLPAGEAVTPAINYEDNKRPTLIWNYIADTVKYKIYHHKKGDSEKVIRHITAKSEDTNYSIKCREILDGDKGVWHFFRVEAEDAYGNISTRRSWRFFCMQPPEPVTAMTIVDGSGAGLFDIKITE